MKTFSKSYNSFISVVNILILIIAFSSCGHSRSEYDKIQKENIVLKDSLTKLIDRFINGKIYYDCIVQLIEKKQYKDAQDSIGLYRLAYPNSNLSSKADSIEKIISSKAKTVLLNTSTLYNYLVGVYQSLQQFNPINSLTIYNNS